MLARTHLLRIQRTMYQRLRDYARSVLGGLQPDLQKYFLEYQRDFKSFEAVTTKHELLDAIQKTNIAICGDYHTLAQAQRTVIRLLRPANLELKHQNRSVILALEMLREKDEITVKNFFEGRLTEGEFLAKIEFQSRWGFDWHNYRDIFEFCRDAGIRVTGLSADGKKSPRLRQRDEFAAGRLARLSVESPGALVFALIGDLHLAQSHLPSQLRQALKQLKVARSIVVVHQNHEGLYWKLAERGEEQHAEVVRLAPDVYCVMNTPPWIKLQSHLKWNEIISSCGPHTGGGGIPLKGDRVAAEAYEEIEHADEIRDLVRSLREFLKIPLPEDDDFSVRGPGDQKYLVKYLRRKGFTPDELTSLQRCMRTFKSHYVPREQILYFSVVSLNHSASQASILLFSKLTGWDRVFLSPREDFYRQLWVESLAYFGSKVINHKRKCKSVDDIRECATSRKIPIGERKVAEFVERHLASERTGKRIITLPTKFTTDRHVVFYTKAAKLLGHLLGHALYRGVIEEKITKDNLRELFHFPLHQSSPLQTRQLYLDWVHRLDKRRYREFKQAESL